MAPESESSAGGERERPTRFRSGDSTSRRVLDDVLRQTASLYSMDPSTEPEDLESLHEVAKKFAGFSFQLDPVCIELIHASLKQRLTNTFASEEELRKISVRVAGVLFENPEAHERLSSLWDRLSSRK